MLAVVAVGVLPPVLYLAFSFHKAVALETANARDHQTALAQNIATSLESYESHIRGILPMLATKLRHDEGLTGATEMMSNLDIKSVKLVEPETGKILAASRFGIPVFDNHVDLDLVESLFVPAFDESAKFGAIRDGGFYGGVIPVTMRSGSELVFALIGTDYFQDVQRRAELEDRQYAAIIDPLGNVITHSGQDWTSVPNSSERANDIQEALREKTGIGRVLASLTGDSDIEGIAETAGPDWGVIVAQPVTTFYARAFDRLLPTMWPWLLVIAGTLFFGNLATRSVIRPTEALIDAMRHQTATGIPIPITPEIGRGGTLEFAEIIDAYNEVANQVQRSSRSLEDQSILDPVTKIGNRIYFEAAASKQLSIRASKGKRGVLLFVDVDNFKEINDTRGHAVGDVVLNGFAQRLFPVTKKLLDARYRGITASYPVIGRIGGDEFAMLVPIADNETDITGLCDQLHAALPTKIHVDGVDIDCKTSIGAALYPDNGTEVHELMRRADVAMYYAKTSGKNAVQLYQDEGMLGGASEIRTAVMSAIINDDLVLEYQPKYCVRTGQITSVEALLRWHHPEFGVVTPAKFLPAVQHTQIIRDLGEWVIARALHDLKALDSGGYHLSVAVNIGAEHFTTPDFVERTKAACKNAGVSPGRLQIEITEEIIEIAPELFILHNKALRDEGITIAIDDYGQGYSNLARLASAPVDAIKLDRSIIWGTTSDKRGAIILQTAITMAHALGASVIVEGVETMEQCIQAQKAGADSMQGYYFSKSLPVPELINWLDTRGKSAHEKLLEEIEDRLSA